MIVTTQFRIKQPNPRYSVFYVEERRADGTWNCLMDHAFSSLESARHFLSEHTSPATPIYYDYP